MRRNLTPDEMVLALLAPPEIPYVDLGLRTGLRLEQITAKLQTIEGLEMEPRDFYELVTDPPAALIADYPWLETALEDAPEGAIAGRLPVAGRLPRPAGHDRRGARPHDARRLHRGGRAGAAGRARRTAA